MTRAFRDQPVFLALLAALLPLAASRAAAQTVITDPSVATESGPQITIVGTAPLPGTGIDRDKVPGNVQSVSSGELSQPGSDLGDSVAAHIPSVSLNDEQGSPAQPDFEYRGFDASPIFGEAQGLAVYQNGTRINEAFGDTVNWDLIPQIAINRLTLQSDNPVFGLNAIGGAVTLDMKTGFTYVGGEFDLSGGSFDRLAGTLQYGKQVGNFATYIALSGYSDDGFRDHSPTTLRQTYADIGAETDRLTLHLAFTGASNAIDAVGPTPIQLLEGDRGAVYTYPQAIDNNLGMLQLYGTYQATGTLALGGTVYYRHFNQRLIDGNTTDAAPCDTASADAGFLCLGGTGSNGAADLLYATNGAPVADIYSASGATPGEIDRTETSTDSIGGGMQASETAPLWGHDNNFVLGVSIDHGETNYATSAELSTQQANYLEIGDGIYIDQALNPTTATELLSPVDLDTTNDYYGLYATDTLDLTDRLSLTLGGRYNLALIDLHDFIGTSINGDHRYGRFNPGTGLTYKLTATITAYIGYSEANRAPTAGELACANPAAPCALDAFLTSDPDLKQVVAHTYETGLRGHFQMQHLPGRFTWHAGLFRTDNTDDIIQVSTAEAGYGYFQNAGNTRRQGIETNLGYRAPRWTVNAGYSLVDATYRSALTLASPSPAADANGLIQVTPGDHLPLIPEHRFTLSGDYDVTDKWDLGADLRLQSGAYLAGDDSNQQSKMPGYYTLDLNTSYQVTPRFQIFAEIDNVTGQNYYTYGTFTQFGDLNATDTFAPGAPRAYYVGMKATF